jgi:formylglycine-generating enzyme required for sulfatase activity
MDFCTWGSSMRRFAVLAGALVLLAFCVLPGHAEKRVGLVVGNDVYRNLPADQQLRTAVNDARAVGDTLARLGFEVVRGENLGRQALIDKLDEMMQRLAPGDTAFFFFAGHGVSIGDGNFILPSDVPDVAAGQETRLRGASLGEIDIVADLRSRGVRVAIVVLDACRNNPFRRPGTRAIGNERGFVLANQVEGTFSLYSAGLGQAALDRLDNADRNPNSVFTRVLLPALAKPDLDLTGLAVEVREEVARLAATTGQVQQPAYYDATIGGRFYLAGPPRQDGGAGRDVDRAERTWNEAKTSKSVAVLEEFARLYEGTFYAALAKDRIEELKKLAFVPPAPPPTPAPNVTGGPCGGVITVSLASRAAGPLSAAEECALNPKEVFKECAQCPEMVVVPAGSFTMGSPDGEDRPKQRPQHQVKFERSFAVGKFAVTFDEWDSCVADGGCRGYKAYDSGWGRGQRPVINVSWDDASAYVAWLSRKTGKTYRLLSEAEREYVTRAGTMTPFWWGDSISPQQANYGRLRTLPVDSFQPNPWGLYQVHGNVWEWTEDCYHDGYAGAPSDGSAWTARPGGGDCRIRVLRGGSWFSFPNNLRAAERYGNSSSAGKREAYFGFRVGRTLTP